ncbi:MotA/TolQ/ExbB proton channel family protein [Rhodoblastus sp.]|uniref:MotA/TolQ/ExbB proton channel family protein n=1 Tax=Rhodoblastus sp. TaxID=1962975 RepID=UPI003F97CEA4
MESLTLTPWGLFLQAGIVVKFVMAALFAASIWCWIVIVEAVIKLGRLRRALAAPDRADGLLARVLSVEPDGLAEQTGIAERRALLAREMTRAARRLLAEAERGLPNLAVVSSVAPFVGLFGTVWGIMTSFAGIAEAKETSLAIVAPGIAEALAATAYGLAAAIPASVGYNRIGAAFNRCGQDLVDLIDERAGVRARKNSLPGRAD